MHLLFFEINNIRVCIYIGHCLSHTFWWEKKGNNKIRILPIKQKAPIKFAYHYVKQHKKKKKCHMKLKCQEIWHEGYICIIGKEKFQVPSPNTSSKCQPKGKSQLDPFKPSPIDQGQWSFLFSLYHMTLLHVT